MLYGPDNKPLPEAEPLLAPLKARMNTCIWCHRRSRLGTKCCNPRYREDSKFNSETRKQRLDNEEHRSLREKAREEVKDEETRGTRV